METLPQEIVNIDQKNKNKKRSKKHDDLDLKFTTSRCCGVVIDDNINAPYNEEKEKIKLEEKQLAEYKEIETLEKNLSDYKKSTGNDHPNKLIIEKNIVDLKIKLKNSDGYKAIQTKIADIKIQKWNVAHNVDIVAAVIAQNVYDSLLEIINNNYQKLLIKMADESKNKNNITVQKLSLEHLFNNSELFTLSPFYNLFKSDPTFLKMFMKYKKEENEKIINNIQTIIKNNGAIDHLPYSQRAEMINNVIKNEPAAEEQPVVEEQSTENETSFENSVAKAIHNDYDKNGKKSIRIKAELKTAISCIIKSTLNMIGEKIKSTIKAKTVTVEFIIDIIKTVINDTTVCNKIINDINRCIEKDKEIIDKLKEERLLNNDSAKERQRIKEQVDEIKKQMNVEIAKVDERYKKEKEDIRNKYKPLIDLVVKKTTTPHENGTSNGLSA